MMAVIEREDEIGRQVIAAASTRPDRGGLRVVYRYAMLVRKRTGRSEPDLFAGVILVGKKAGDIDAGIEMSSSRQT